MDRLLQESKGKAPDAPLLHIPSHPAREWAEDLKTAGIRQWTPEGKVDFHSLRVVFINRVIEVGATVKEAQTLTRHLDPRMTANVYDRSRQAALTAAVESLTEAPKSGPECAIGVQPELARPASG